MRTFIAIDILNKEKIIQVQDNLIKQYELDTHYARPTKYSNLHLTIIFLGEKTDSKLNKIISSLNSFTFDAFEVVFDKMGCFPNVSKPKVIWLGIDDKSSQRLNDIYIKILTLIQQDVEENKGNSLYPNNGIEVISKFVPHLTIFRVKSYYTFKKSFRPISNTVICKEKIKHISLKQSILKPDGPFYSDLFVINAYNGNAF